MKQLKIGIALLLAVLVLALGVSIAMHSVHTQISDTLQQAENFAEQSDYYLCTVRAGEAYAKWQRHWHSIAACTDHADMDQIDSAFAELRAYSASGQTQELAACCAKLFSLVNAIADSQCLCWWNLL